jgi:hypothetical protein
LASAPGELAGCAAWAVLALAAAGADTPTAAASAAAATQARLRRLRQLLVRESDMVPLLMRPSAKAPPLGAHCRGRSAGFLKRERTARAPAAIALDILAVTCIG